MLLAVQSSRSGVDDIIIWSMVLIVLVVVGLAVALRVKRRMIDDDGAGHAPAAGFTLSDLRKMLADGHMTPEEFEKARALIVASARGSGQRPTSDEPTRN